MSVSAVTARRRSELEVAAEAVMQVVDSGLLPKTPQVVANVAAATGIAVGELRAAWRRIQDYGYTPPRERPALALVEDEPPRRAASKPSSKPGPRPYTPPKNLTGGNRRKFDRTHPTPDTRVCTRCGETKSTGEFHLKNKATGNVQAICKECQKAANRDRYLKVGSVAVSVELLDGDGCLGETCPGCGKPFEVGQRVKGDHLRHEVCV